MNKSKTQKAVSGVFSQEEREAMRARARELKAEARANQDRDEGEKQVVAAIAAMPPESKKIGEKLHSIIKASAPELSPKTWYGMPAYANKDGKVVCFFRGAEKFKERYMTFGFNDIAKIDHGAMWPIAFAILSLTPAEEERIAELVKLAVG